MEHLCEALSKSRSFICYNVQDVKDKVMILKDLGYTSRQIINQPKILIKTQLKTTHISHKH